MPQFPPRHRLQRAQERSGVDALARVLIAFRSAAHAGAPRTPRRNLDHGYASLAARRDGPLKPYSHASNCIISCCVARSCRPVDWRSKNYRYCIGARHGHQCQSAARPAAASALLRLRSDCSSIAAASCHFPVSARCGGVRAIAAIIMYFSVPRGDGPCVAAMGEVPIVDATPRGSEPPLRPNGRVTPRSLATFPVGIQLRVTLPFSRSQPVPPRRVAGSAIGRRCELPIEFPEGVRAKRGHPTIVRLRRRDATRGHAALKLRKSPGRAAAAYVHRRPARFPRAA